MRRFGNLPRIRTSAWLIPSAALALLSAAGCGRSAHESAATDAIAEQLPQTPGRSEVETKAPPATAAAAVDSPVPPQEPPRQPARVEEARAAFDLATFPLLEDADRPGEQSLATLFYEAPGDVSTAFEFQRQHLIAAGWKEIPGGYASETSANGTFEREGYLLSASVSASGGGDGARLNVFLVNHGNVDTARLPTPAGVTPFYQAPVSTAYITSQPVDEMVAAVRQRLLDDGWQLYGTAGDQRFYKQNAIRLSASVSSAPAQDNQTVIAYSTELMSADIPAPAEFLDAQYSDSTKTLAFDTSDPIDAIARFYVETLGKAGWKPTTEQPIEMDWKRVLIFRNDAMDLMELEAREVDGKTRATVEFQTAAEVAEMDRLVKAEQERLRQEREAEANRPKPTVAIRVPEEAENVEQDATELKFNVASGQAAAAYDAIRRQLIADGWEAEQETKDVNLGHVSLRKDGHGVTVTFVETGILPSEVTVSGFGVQVRTAE